MNIVTCICTLAIVLPVFAVTISANPTPVTDLDCPSSGSKQIVYPNDCSKYYQCENGQKEARSCPESLFFNANIGSCDFLDNTACQRPTAAPTKPTPANSVTTPSPTITTTVNPNPDRDCPASGTKQIGYRGDCTKYYQCDGGHKELRDCPENLFFNAEIGACDFLDNTACQGPTPASTKPTPATTVTTAIPIITTVNPNPDEGCPASGRKQIPYLGDCSKFYQCEDGHKEVRDCPESLFFNAEIGACDFLDNTACQGPTPAPTKPTAATTVTTPVPIITTVNPNPDKDCPASGTKQIPYLEDCSKYYQCKDGHKEVRDCPESLFFNAEKGACDFLENTACQAPTYAPTDAPPTEAPTNPPTEAPPTEAPTVPPTDAPPTEAPTVPPTDAPPTEAPTNPPTQAPPTEAPTNPPTQAPPTEAPTNPPTDAPPTEAPTNPPTDAPPTEAPTNPPTDAPPTEAPTNPPTDAPPTEAPTNPPTDAPPTEAPTNPPTDAPPTEAPTDAPTTTTIAPPKTSQNPTTPTDSICHDHPEGAYVANPDDCSSFFECHAGHARKVKCPLGTFWNKTKGSCDLEQNVDC